ncbi:hypothetical protein BC628DRAFT_917700 [Trametes gibbosa]|nr:hypothetical protein BC628DRAFT_917700 [Trametes gibbosa]
MTGTLALAMQAPSAGMHRVPEAPKPNILPSIQVKARPTGPRRPRTQSELNDIRLRRVSAAVACPSSKHSLPTPGILLKHRRHSARLSSASSFTSASSRRDPPSLFNTPYPFKMTSTTTTMTLSPPPGLRVSDTTPPFVLQQRHDFPPYFLYRAPTTTSHHRPSASPLRQKRFFNIDSGIFEELDAKTEVAAQLVEPDKSLASATIATPMPTPPSSAAALPVRFRAKMSPPPEKALPPIPFPSYSALLVADPSRTAFLENATSSPHCKAPRPASQGKEETIRQLEQLAAELKHMKMGPLSDATRRRVQNSPSRLFREAAPHMSPRSVGVSKASLSVPRIVVTNASTDIFMREQESETSSVSSSDSHAGSGNAMEEELWVEEYGAWGTSEKGKWKASASEDDVDFNESGPSQGAPLGGGRPVPAVEPEEMFYIYEPIVSRTRFEASTPISRPWSRRYQGAPEFLVGSSTSPIARATPGFHSRATRSKPPTQAPSVCRRRRRPTALVLATPEQAEWFQDVAPSSAPHLSRPFHTSSHRTLSIPLPSSACSLPDAAAPPSPYLPPRRTLSSDAAVDVPSSMSSHKGSSTMSTLVRRSEPLGPMPCMSSASALHDEGGKERQTVSWASSAPVTTSAPNSPRQASRPRLKSFKGLFKHFSK